MIKIKNIRTLCLICLVLAVLGLAGCYSAQYQYGYSGEIEHEPEPVAFDVNAAMLGSRFNRTTQLRQPTPEEAERYPQLTNLPTLYITFEYLTSIRSLTRGHHFLPGSYTLVKGDEGGFFNEPLNIKRRGAWSYSHAKRPYTVDLMTDTSWGGLPAASRWILIANWSDKSLMRNHVTFQLLRRVTDDWSPNSFFADVFINGRYEGTYLITDSIEIHENRLNLDIATEAVFEINAIFRCKSDYNCRDCIPLIDGRHHIIYKRPGGVLCAQARQRNLALFREFFAGMQTSLSLGYEAYSQFIDVPSFVNWYIVHELTKNFDSAFTASVYAFMKNGRLHMGPGWDYDTIFGNQEIGPPTNKLNPEGFWINSSPWFRRLMNDATFERLVQERWTELRQEGVFCEFFSELVDETAAHIAESAALNFEVWPCAISFHMRGPNRSHSHEAEIDYIRNWVARRVEWLDTQWYIG